MSLEFANQDDFYKQDGDELSFLGEDKGLLLSHDKSTTNLANLLGEMNEGDVSDCLLQ